MALIFDPMTDDQSEGTNRAELGPGRATTAGVVLQGFSMSYSGTDRHLNVIEANTGSAGISVENGNVYVTYRFRCEMVDANGHHTKDNRLNSVVVANVVVTQDDAEDHAQEDHS